MTLAGLTAFASSNRSNSTRTASFENTLKLTPPSQTVAPSGALVPDFTRPRSSFIHAHCLSETIAWTFQISRQYSRTERSEEERPTRAVLRMDMRIQAF